VGSFELPIDGLLPGYCHPKFSLRRLKNKGVIQIAQGLMKQDHLESVITVIVDPILKVIVVISGNHRIEGMWCVKHMWPIRAHWFRMVRCIAYIMKI